jgi:UDP-2-acetamido-2-deoxy-ribo-hexuluronate aminotransferase
MEFIDLKTQYARYRTAIDSRMAAVLQHGHFIMGPEIAELEAALAAFVGVKHCLTVASGTTSLEIALRALNIGPGDEVITVPFTWISSAEVIGLVGAKPVFVDIEAASYNLDIARLEEAITPRTKAIMPVSLFGQMPDYARINAIAQRHHIPVIEDAAQSFGATQRFARTLPQSGLPLRPLAGGEGQGEGDAVRRSCGVTTIGSTSFFPAKPFGCYGDGGALFTNDDALAEKMRAIRTHGGLKRHHHPYLGTNGRFDTLQAAVLLAKFPNFDWEVAERARIGARYSELLAPVLASDSLSAGGEGRGEVVPQSAIRNPQSAIPAVAPGNTHVYAQYTIRVPNRDTVATKLKEKGIPTAVYYPKCLHEQPVFASSGYKWGDFPEAEKASREVLSLPMHPFLTEADQDTIVTAVKSAV